MQDQLFDVYVKTGELWSGPLVLDADALKKGTALNVAVKNGQCQVLLYQHDALTKMSESQRLTQLEYDRAILYPKKPFQTVSLLNSPQALQTKWNPLTGLAIVDVPFRHAVPENADVTCFLKTDGAWLTDPIAVEHHGSGFTAANLPVGTHSFLLFEGIVTKTAEELIILEHLASSVTVFDTDKTITEPFYADDFTVHPPTLAINDHIPPEFEPETFTLLGGGQKLSEHDTMENIDTVRYFPMKKGTTNADLESMGLAVEDNMKMFRSTTATESFFADLVDPEEEEDELPLDWIGKPLADRNVHDLLFADY